jgi:uncharacterized membrane-anchored protein YitT (DUF2179 family)
VTAIDAEGMEGPVKVLFNIISRKKLPDVIKLIKHHNPNAFYTIEDLRFVKEGTIPAALLTARPTGLFRK